MKTRVINVTKPLQSFALSKGGSEGEGNGMYDPDEASLRRKSRY